jgi:hypothetical protein
MTSAVLVPEVDQRIRSITSQRADCGSKTIRSRVRVAGANRSVVSVDGRTLPPSIRAIYDGDVVMRRASCDRDSCRPRRRHYRSFRAEWLAILSGSSGTSATEPRERARAGPSVDTARDRSGSRDPAHARPTRNASVGGRRARALLLSKPQTLAADNHRIFVPHQILTSAERSTVSAGCESSAWFSSCAPSPQAQCRAQVCENPMIYASTIGKAVSRRHVLARSRLFGRYGQTAPWYRLDDKRLPP